MRRSRLELSDCQAVAEELGLAVNDVERMVDSFFGCILSQARGLPFNKGNKIYSKQMFDTLVSAYSIPHIGRIGPVYSRYLKWRANASKTIRQEARSKYRLRLTQSDIEKMAGEILSGNVPEPLKKKKGNELYNRVWLVDTDGRKLARQVIPKEKKDVQD